MQLQVRPSIVAAVCRGASTFLTINDTMVIDMHLVFDADNYWYFTLSPFCFVIGLLKSFS